MFNILHEIYVDWKNQGIIKPKDVFYPSKNGIEDFGTLLERQMVLKAIVQTLWDRAHQQIEAYHNADLKSRSQSLTPIMQDVLVLHRVDPPIAIDINSFADSPSVQMTVRPAVCYLNISLMLLLKESEITKRADDLLLSDTSSSIVSGTAPRHKEVNGERFSVVDRLGVQMYLDYISGDRDKGKQGILDILGHELGHAYFNHIHDHGTSENNGRRAALAFVVAMIIIIVGSVFLARDETLISEVDTLSVNASLLLSSIIPIGIGIYKYRKFRKAVDHSLYDERMADLFALHHFPENAAGCKYFYDIMNSRINKTKHDRNLSSFQRVLFKILFASNGDTRLATTHPKNSERIADAENVLAHGSALGRFAMPVRAAAAESAIDKESALDRLPTAASAA